MSNHFHGSRSLRGIQNLILSLVQIWFILDQTVFFEVVQLLIRAIKNPFIMHGQRSSNAFNGQPFQRPLSQTLRAFLGQSPLCGIFQISVIMARSIIKAFHAIKAPHVSHMEILAIILQAAVSRLDRHTFLVHLPVMPLCSPVILCYMYHCPVGLLPATKTYTSLLSRIILSAL